VANEEPYIDLTAKRGYNPSFGDDRMCGCGHRYKDHFDPDGMGRQCNVEERYNMSFLWMTLKTEPTLCGCGTFVEYAAVPYVISERQKHD